MSEKEFVEKPFEQIPSCNALVVYRPPGRPTKINKETVDEFCHRVALGESVRHICLLDHMPHRDTIYEWLLRFPEFSDQYARAKALQMDGMAEDIIDIVDDGRNDWELRENSRTGAVYVALNAEHVARSRLRLEARKWLMEKLRPTKYGPAKPQDAPPPIQISIIGQILKDIQSRPIGLPCFPKTLN